MPEDPLELDGRALVETGVAPPRILEALDEVEHSEPREYRVLWTFADVDCVEPTKKSSAERAPRKAVLWRKSSFGSASRSGSLFAERMLPVCKSPRAQGRSPLDLLVAAVWADMRRLKPRSLIPAPPSIA